MAEQKSEARRSESKSSRTRSRILHSAARIFRQHGYAVSSLRDIAEDAGMKAGSLYYHFDSKELLAEAVLDAGVEGARRCAQEAVDALGAEANPIEKIEAALRGHLSYLLTESDFAVASVRMLHQTPDAVRTRHMRKQRAYGRFFAGFFEDAQEAGMIRPEFNLSALRMLLIGAANWTPEWYDQSGLSTDELAGQMSALLQKGVMPENVSLVQNSTKPRRRSEKGDG